MATCPVYVFRSAVFAPSGNTVVSVAPQSCVVSVYGGGGGLGVGGLESVFGRSVVFKNDASGERFVGVWGARNASRFRSQLRAHMEISLQKEAPDARLVFIGTASGVNAILRSG